MYKKVLIVFLCFLCIACSSNKDDDKSFKKVYEDGNGEYIDLDISSEYNFKISTVDEINSILDNGTGVIYIGNEEDNLSRKVVDILTKVFENTDLNIIYTISFSDDIDLKEIDREIPLVLFVVDGEVKSYHVGTIDNKVQLSDEEEVKLYQIYLEGVEEVLNSACRKKC